MLNREVAQAQLRTVYIADWRSQRIQQMGNLPQLLQSIGYGILGYDADGRRFNSVKLYEVQNRSLQQFDELVSSDRLQILSVIFPKFAAIVEAAWQLIAQLPYQSTYSRRAFRSPNHPELSAAQRQSWLQKLITAVEGYDQDLEWFAVWVPYLNYYTPDVLGILLAAAINQNDALGQTIFDSLTESASGNHDIGAMGRHITRALLIANRVDGWDFIERLLLAAQRQEGLRQTILETIDEAHPIAFRRMLRLIVEQNLTRFSATIRAVDVWFGFGLESLNEKLALQMLSQVVELLENPDAQAAALHSEDPQTVYLALWTAGFVDAIAAIDLATPLLDHPQATHRFVAVHFLAQLDITPARFIILSAVGDSDLGVATCAVQALSRTGDAKIHQESDAFERLEQVLPNFPVKPKTLSVVWEWIKLEPSQNLVASVLVQNLRKASDLRRGILGLLLNQPDDVAIASAQRLLQAKLAPQRQARLELLRELVYLR